MIIPPDPSALIRVTVTLPAQLVRQVDERTQNRSRFIAAAVQRELHRRAGVALRRSLATPHPESAELSEAGFADWAAALPPDDANDLVNLRAGRPVRWTAGRGWETSPAKRGRHR